MFVTGSALDVGNDNFLLSAKVPWLGKPFTMRALHEMSQKVLRNL
jgi:hypothetical protein